MLKLFAWNSVGIVAVGSIIFKFLIRKTLQQILHKRNLILEWGWAVAACWSRPINSHVLMLCDHNQFLSNICIIHKHFQACGETEAVIGGTV